MWNWILKLLKSRQNNTTGATGDLLVNDEDYEFKVGTKPTLPEGLRHLKITELGSSLLLLEHFDAELTVDQKAWDRTVHEIATATRIYRWASCYHDLARSAHVPVRLYGENLLLIDSHYTETNGPEADLSTWLDHMGWSEDRAYEVQQAQTEKPLEHGFFSCLRITMSKAPEPSDSRLVWKPWSGCAPSIRGTLAAFVQQELAQPWGRHGCETYLRECYRNVPREQMIHPVFALIDFPVFDMGMLRMTFAGAVLSHQELRLWSRPTYYHK